MLILLEGPQSAANNLESRDQARGEEIKRLKSELNNLSESKEAEFRQLMHEVALLKADNGRLKANLVNLRQLSHSVITEHIFQANHGQPLMDVINFL